MNLEAPDVELSRVHRVPMPAIAHSRRPEWIGIAWKEIGSRSKAKLKEKWGQLTDDDLNVIDGRRDQLEGKLQERYGWAKDQVRRDVDDWLSAQR